MSTASRYWLLVIISTTGSCQTREITKAKAFFKQQFSETDASDADIQRQLLHLLRQEQSSDDTTSLMAELCLRCLISSQIEQVCTQIAVQFGGKHGFTRYDLFPFVLNDVGSTRVQSSYKSFATEILK